MASTRAAKTADPAAGAEPGVAPATDTKPGGPSATDTKPGGRSGTGAVPAADDNTPALTYEQARDELTEVVSRLESGTETLAASMELFARGELLAGLCERYLTDAQALVEKAVAPAA